jgi:hypothetical protein
MAITQHPGVQRQLKTTVDHHLEEADAKRASRIPSTPRTLSCGSSWRTVPMPVRMAQARARQRCPSCRAAGPVSHWLAPFRSAVLPSRLAASFRRSHGRERVIRATKPMLISCASAAIRPHSAQHPSLLQASPARCPATCGLGSRMAATTRVTPAAKQRFDARWRAAMVTARFERDIGGRTACRLTGRLQGRAFRHAGRRPARCQPSPTTCSRR